MKKGFHFLTLLVLASLLFTQCECIHNNDGEGTCFEFDRRQCAGDEWSEAVPISANQEEQEKNMEAYLESKGIKTFDVVWIENYHEAVCEACFVCPLGDRFQVRIDEDDASKLEDMELLNFAELDCGEL